MATIYDIAKKVGVSPTTVSKVFNNYSDVSEKTKAKILKAADELGYVPNIMARSLRTDKSYLIGVMFSEDLGIGLEHQFFSVVLESFRKKIGSYGYDTIFINKSLGNQNMGYIDHCKHRNIDGLFIITALPEDMDFDKLFKSGMKCVTTDVVFDNVPYVMSDNENGAVMAVNHLYDKGHRKIAHLSGPFNTISAVERFVGYKRAVEELGIGYDEKYLIESEMFKYDDAYKATLELFERCKGDYPTALFVGADIMAVAAMAALETIGLNVPDDVSVIGFDDVMVAKYANPGLTTIRQDKKEIGKQIAEKLYSLMNNEDCDYGERLEVSLVERGTVKDIN